MSSCYETTDCLGQTMFGHTELGDRRRTARVVTVFEQMRRHPGGTLPDKLSTPADLKALYRLCASEAVTHKAIIAAMRAYTLERIADGDGSVLVVHDWTELDYTSLVSLASELGQIGKGTRSGQGLDELSRFTMDIQAQKGRKARKQAEFAIRGGPILLLPPHAKHGHHGDDPLPMYVVYVSEVSRPPKGEKPIDWMLLTNEPVRNLKDAWRVVEWYERRWVIEEYHKAMKTGCRIEDLQFTAVQRLQPAIALLSAVALTLLNLRDASRRRDASTRRATTLFAPEYVDVPSIWRYGRTATT